MGRYPAVQRVTPRWVRFFGFGLWRSWEEPIYLAEYDVAWPARFEQLSKRIRAVLGDLARRVEHVGSTAVPRLAAKPVIDLDVVVDTARDVPPSIQRLATIGYAHEGDLGIAGRDAFRWPPAEEPHHVYLLVEGARELTRHLAFRDALRADSGLRERYTALKRSLSRQYPNDRAAYTSGKQEFIEDALRRAGYTRPD